MFNHIQKNLGVKVFYVLDQQTNKQTPQENKVFSNTRLLTKKA